MGGTSYQKDDLGRKGNTPNGAKHHRQAFLVELVPVIDT